MKRTLGLILAILMLVSIVGCDRTNPNETGNNDDNQNKEPTININDTYRFYTPGIQENLMKLNVKTGMTTTVCTDPVCVHGNDCLFSNVVMSTVEGDTMYFCRQNDQIASYSIITGKVKNVYRGSDPFSSQRIQGRLMVKGGYIYFYRKENFTEEEMLRGDYKYTLYRVSTDGGDCEKMCTVEQFDYYENGKYIFYKDSEQPDTIFAFDTETKTMVEFLRHPDAINIGQIHIDYEDGILFALYKADIDQVYKYDRKNDKYNLIYEAEDFSGLQVHNGDVYLTQNGKLCKLNTAKRKSEVIFEAPEGEILSYSFHGESHISYNIKGQDYYTFYSANTDTSN